MLLTCGGDPKGGGYDFQYDGHYTVTGASALFKSTTGSTVQITAFDDADTGGEMVVGNGVKDQINGVSITYFGVSYVSPSGSQIIVPTSEAITYTVNGHAFTVQLVDGSVLVSGVSGDTGSSLNGTVIAVYTQNGYNSVEYTWAAGENFQIGDFGATTLSKDPVSFTVPIQVVDGDGDVAASSISVTAITPAAPPIPPIVIDLDGDGAEFSSLSAGVMFDYDGNGIAHGTAWAGADDGILAIDRNGDGIVNDGSEIVFGGDGLTDLEGLAAKYDSNGDGVLDANDADFAKFGVWQDANQNGVTDEGEFHSLSEMGIVSINLTSDNVVYSAADGDVLVHGTGTYTMADGSTGTLADASFMTLGGEDLENRLSTTATTTALVASAGLALVAETVAASETAPAPSGSTDETAVSSEPVATVDPTPTSEAEPAPTVSQLTEETSSSEPQHGSTDHASATDDAPATLAQVVDYVSPTEAHVDAHADGHADLGMSVTAFDFASAGAGQLMDALLLAAQASDGAAEGQGQSAMVLPSAQQAIGEALADSHGEAIVDHLVQQLAGDSHPAASGQGEASSLLATLFVQVAGDASHPVAFDFHQTIEDASALAVAHA